MMMPDDQVSIYAKRTYKFAPPSAEKPDPELVIKYIFKGRLYSFCSAVLIDFGS